jgi:quinol monooxygenase YgiN
MTNHLFERREFLLATGAAALVPLGRAMRAQTLGGAMYGLIGKITAAPGQREALAAVLLEGTQAMPGCLSYIVARDATDPDALWVTEVWDGPESHKASLSLPAVQAAIAKGRPLIAGFSNRVETVPLGGQGLPRAEPR